MQVICLEEEAFFVLIDKVLLRVKEAEERSWKWITPEQAMKLLDISSKTTLQNLRDENAIRYTQPRPKLILYDRESIEAYLSAHSNKKH
ncbi:helix-turn-helix domain-containing protein [Dawidia soli]|uniref:Helix-turn-helix domain-containing protein n=1 Tax=Dawidia soli TaxID=2782352 RepID=A0AAP2DDR9_9BACT|nr:helix-turn-helix domain-containing protein [Dawidia soli]MBT1689878.1 helix-turn-helix domain-containing protein [Dawidia soli]